jgi:hypothetical protein
LLFLHFSRPFLSTVLLSDHGDHAAMPGAPGKPGFGFLGWNVGDLGDSTLPDTSLGF